jgi:hypothetical protein
MIIISAILTEKEKVNAEWSYITIIREVKQNVPLTSDRINNWDPVDRQPPGWSES